MPFTLQQEKTIPQINATAKLFVHDKTGARLLSLTNDDENKCFGINFRTPPADSTGIAHIMEHSVLCGSRKYPVKEPFVELVKGSLNTFLNAFTYPDKTCYPVASQNLKDFYNLIDVYLDAVFYPLIPPETLEQEGWHCELESREAPLTYKGVVFNEMKGNYSSPDGILGDQSQRSIFPDNLYSFDSGGDPAAIPDLTYAAFKAFHESYYHPSNAFIYFYGDDPEDERLHILDAWLQAFDRKDVDSHTPLQPKFNAPRSVRVVYDSGDSEDAKAYLQLNWLMPEVTDLQTTLALMLGALGPWVYEGDPLAALAFEAPLAGVRAGIAKGRYFETLIEQHLLNNPHRSSVTLLPDPEEGKRCDGAERARLEKAKAAMSPAELEEVVAVAEELKHRQETPDSPEALASLPALSLSDIDPKIKAIPIEISEVGGVKTINHALFTNSILYLDLGFDLHALPADLLPYAGLFGRLLLEMGTAKDDFVRLTQHIGRDTGGIRPSALTSAVRPPRFSRGEPERSAAWLFLRSKAVASQSAALLDILKDILLGARLDNRERFKQIVLEEKAGMEAGLVPGGHQVVNRRLRARFSEADWISEQLSGLEQLFFLRELAEALEKDWPAVLEKLEKVQQLLLNRKTMIANVTLDDANWKNFSPQLAAFIETLPAYQPAQSVFIRESVIKSAEGLTIPAQVNYVAKGADLYKLGYKLHGSVQVINKFLGTTWLWEKIRVQGGAYGGFSVFDMHSGTYTFLSYRDPNLLASLDNYDATAGFLRTLELSDAELGKSIIGTIGDLDAYLLPDAKGSTSMTRHLIGYTDEQRQQIRDEILGTTAQDFKSFGETLEAVAKHGEIVVLGSAEAIEKANQERDGLLEVKKVM